ncbi:MAG: NlpC/P60 family protein, partial [Hyphomonadaceae bacterium]
MSFDPATDRRLLPVHDGVAAEHLKGRVEAKRFVEGETWQVAVGHAALKASPDWAAETLDQALFGERIRVYLQKGGWGWGQLERDGYVGWLPLDRLSRKVVEPTHYIRALRTIVFSAPSPKAEPLIAISMTAPVAFEEEDGAWRKLAGSGWIYGDHAAPLGLWQDDFVSVALRFVGTPYLWGGRESAGIDCSGLVQVALQACGRSPLRDSDMQAATLGEPLDGAVDPGALLRGDLLFWKGHVGIALGDGRL